MNVVMFSSADPQCGVADYTQYLTTELRRFVNLTITPYPPAKVRLRRDIDAETYRRLGLAAADADIAHIQYDHLFFGGIRPGRSHFRIFLQHLNIPVVATIHEIRLASLRLTSPFLAFVEGFYRRLFYRRMLRHPKILRFIVHTKEHFRLLRAVGIPESAIFVIPMGVPLHLVRSYDPLYAKHRYGLIGKRVLTIFGFVNRRKGYELAISALKDLPDDVVLLIAGGVPDTDTSNYFARLQKVIEESGVAHRVHITGYLSEEEFPVVMAATDLILAPFTEMSGSASLSLGLAYGKPIIASNLQPNRDIVDEQDCLALFGIKQPETLGPLILDLLYDRERQKALAENARDYADRHSYAQMAEAIYRVYQQVYQTIQSG
jgi:glycosyltransferase involved in cell wall biosynthesis